MGLFKTKFKDVHVNPPPETKRDRNAARLDRINLRLADLKKRGLAKSDRYKALRVEQKKRKAIEAYYKATEEE